MLRFGKLLLVIGCGLAVEASQASAQAKPAEQPAAPAKPKSSQPPKQGQAAQAKPPATAPSKQQAAASTETKPASTTASKPAATAAAAAPAAAAPAATSGSATSATTVAAAGAPKKAAAPVGPSCKLEEPEQPRGGRLDVTGSGFGSTPLVRVAGKPVRMIERREDRLSVQIPADSDGGPVAVQAGGKTQNCGRLVIIGKNR